MESVLFSARSPRRLRRKLSVFQFPAFSTVAAVALRGGGLVVAGVADPGPASPRPATSAKTFFAIFAGFALKNKSIVVRDPRGLCVENKPEHVGGGTRREARFIWRLAIWGLSFFPWI
jgi:hypothetical protein